MSYLKVFAAGFLDHAWDDGGRFCVELSRYLMNAPIELEQIPLKRVVQVIFTSRQFDQQFFERSWIAFGHAMEDRDVIAYRTR